MLVLNQNVKEINLSQQNQILPDEKDLTQVEKLWRGQKKIPNQDIAPQRLQKLGMSISRNGTDVVSLRKIIDKHYKLERDVIYMKEDNFLNAHMKYPDFIDRGGYEGILKEIKCLPFCNSEARLQELNHIRDKVYTHTKHYMASKYYYFLLYKKEMSIQYFLSAEFDGVSFKKSFGLDDNFVLKDLNDLLTRVEEFAVLRLELTKRKERKNNTSKLELHTNGRHWDDRRYQHIYNPYYDTMKKIERIVKTKYLNKSQEYTCWSKVKLLCCCLCVNSGCVREDKLARMDEKVYKDYVMGAVSSYPEFKKRKPDMTNESFTIFWTTAIKDTGGIGRNRDDIKKDIATLLEIIQKTGDWSFVDLDRTLTIEQDMIGDLLQQLGVLN